MFIMVIAVFVIMLVFMILLVIVFMMHFGDETIAFDMIKAHTQIQRGEAKVIRAKKPSVVSVESTGAIKASSPMIEISSSA